MNKYDKYNENEKKEEFLKVFMSELRMQEEEYTEKIGKKEAKLSVMQNYNIVPDLINN
jgi:hypothetical protein